MYLKKKEIKKQKKQKYQRRRSRTIIISLISPTKIQKLTKIKNYTIIIDTKQYFTVRRTYNKYLHVYGKCSYVIYMYRYLLFKPRPIFTQSLVN